MYVCLYGTRTLSLDNKCPFLPLPLPWPSPPGLTTTTIITIITIGNTLYERVSYIHILLYTCTVLVLQNKNVEPSEDILSKLSQTPAPSPSPYLLYIE